MKINCLIICLLFLLAFVNILIITQMRTSNEYARLDENYFITANYFNSEDALKFTLPEIQRLLKTLQKGHNVYISFFENGSTDKTAEILEEFKDLIDVPNTIITCNMTGSDT